MTGRLSLVRMGRLAALGLALWAPLFSLFGSEATVVKTNWSNRWITNVIEVNMPVNRFVNEYRTNRVDVYFTNRVTRTVTNSVTLTVPQTNYAIAFRTNWNMVTVTNPVTVEELWTNTVVVYQTNLIMRTRTNQVVVNLIQTNLVTNYRTNWSTLNLTNLETVVLFKTNWVTQVVTNTVPVEAPVPAPAVPAKAREPLVLPPDQADPLPAVAVAGWTGPLAIKAVRTSRPVANNLVEVEMKVYWTAPIAGPLELQQWRVEREDGAVLLFGQEQEFKRQLPAGKYKVEARLKAKGDNPPPIARGTLSVSAQDVAVQPRLLVRK